MKIVRGYKTELDLNHTHISACFWQALRLVAAYEVLAKTHQGVGHAHQ
ncbi:MAG: hypothetical protein JO202_00710 [Ktedonobacteraceae bacterium]|nr:hypothetical protein [Ktedonobacteraceae bacterium]